MLPTACSAGYVAAPGGPRFQLVWQPDGGAPVGTVVLAHAFAEEMNKSRRMCARLARQLAGQGWRVVQRDLAGCGDSALELRDATWQAWIDDLDAELQQAPRPVWLWCVRAGALLAPPLLERHRDAGLLLWQPVLSGAQHLQQFLRLHAGARIAGSAKAAEQPSAPARLRGGETVEVGGYEITPALAGAMQAARFCVPAGYAGRVAWFELTQATAAAQAAAARLRQDGIDVDLEAVAGPPFWQTLEVTECDDLLERTCACLRSARTAPSPAATLAMEGSGFA